MGSEELEDMQRQHMSPGAEIQGVGIGATLYMAGALQSAFRWRRNPLTTCTASPKVEEYSFDTNPCEDVFGGDKTDDAIEWWDNAVDRGFADEMYANCAGEPEEDTSYVNVEIDPQTLESAFDRAIDHRFILEAFEGEHGYLPHSASVDYVDADIDSETYVITISGAVKKSGWSFSSTVERQIYEEHQYSGAEIDISEISEAEFEFSIEVSGDLEVEDDEIVGIASVDMDVMVDPAELEVDYSLIVESEGILQTLCGGELINRYKLMLASSSEFDRINTAPPEVYGQMSLEDVNPKVLAALLEYVSESHADGTDYVVTAIEAMRESKYNKSRDRQDVLEGVQDILVEKRVIPDRYQKSLPFDRTKNPSNRVKQELMRDARELQALADLDG